MQNVWKKIKEKWLDYWQDDMLDRTKTHLSQYDKRSLLYGGVYGRYYDCPSLLTSASLSVIHGR